MSVHTDNNKSAKENKNIPRPGNGKRENGVT